MDKPNQEQEQISNVVEQCFESEMIPDETILQQQRKNSGSQQQNIDISFPADLVQDRSKFKPKLKLVQSSSLRNVVTPVQEEKEINDEKESKFPKIKMIEDNLEFMENITRNSGTPRKKHQNFIRNRANSTDKLQMVDEEKRDEENQQHKLHSLKMEQLLDKNEFGQDINYVHQPSYKCQYHVTIPPNEEECNVILEESDQANQQQQKKKKKNNYSPLSHCPQKIIGDYKKVDEVVQEKKKVMKDDDDEMDQQQLGNMQVQDIIVEETQQEAVEDSVGKKNLEKALNKFNENTDYILKIANDIKDEETQLSNQENINYNNNNQNSIKECVDQEAENEEDIIQEQKRKKSH